MGAFGDKFRKERERRGLTLDDVSNVTKIGSRMLKAIEDEHFDQLPGGIFNKGFIRAYARHLGLNDEEAVTEYLSALRQAQVDAENTSAQLPQTHTTPAQPKATDPYRPAVRPSSSAPAEVPVARAGIELPELQLPRAEHIRPRRPLAGSNRGEIPWRVPALVLAVILVGMFLWNRHSRSARAEGTNPPPATASSPVSSPVPSPSQPSGNDSTLVHPSSTTTSADSAVPTHQTGSPTPASESGPADENDVTTNLKPHRPDSTTPEPAPALRLIIRASENSWISVVADGQPVIQETLIAPAHTSIRASSEIVVKAGNAAGVSFLLNGKEFSPQGNEAEVKTFVFDTSGMRVLSSTQSP